MQDVGNLTFVRHTALNTFRNQLHCLFDITLKVTILTPLLHRTDRAHATISLIGTALIENLLTRCLVGAGKHRPEHTS